MSTSSIPLPYQPRYKGSAVPLGDAEIYKSLDRNNFRLLDLHGYTSQNVLKCSLHTVAHGESGDYSTISYTWNEAQRVWYGRYDISPKPVEINSKLVHVPDKVANILCLALQHNRVRVWLDAICINQSDSTEKGRQVFQMGKIYSGATEVLCFLNRPSSKTDQVLDKIHLHSQTPLEAFSAQQTLEFHFLLEDEYWRRAWTLQETVLAKSAMVCCGSKIVPLSEIEQFRRSIAETGKPMWRDVTAIPKMLAAATKTMRDGIDPFDIWNSRQVRPGADFVDILQQCWALRFCYDPRDLIYSRLALSPQSSTLVPFPDYSISVEELYKKFAADCIRVTGSLKVITSATKSSRDLPSWVPDWTSVNSGWKLDKSEADEVVTAMESLSWQTAKDLPQISADGNELHVQGKALDVVRERDAWDTKVSKFVSFSGYRQAYAESEIPQSDDVICILKQCPSVVFLRPCGDDCHTVVGRTSMTQSAFVRNDSRQAARENLGNANDLPEVIFKIR